MCVYIERTMSCNKCLEPVPSYKHYKGLFPLCVYLNYDFVIMSSHCKLLGFFFQHVIPQTLLDHYVSMTEPAKAQTIDTEIVRHCAFSLPAVALTLGRKNWPCLRDTYELLTSDMQVGQ